MSNLQPFFRCTVSAAWRTGGWNSGLSHRQPEALGAKVFLQGEIVLSKKGFTMLKMTFWQHFDGMICIPLCSPCIPA
jgi:hypothetical protein